MGKSGFLAFSSAKRSQRERVGGRERRGENDENLMQVH